jgi:Fic family protein
MPYKPPYTITSSILKQVSEISQLIGRIEGYQLLPGSVRLRNRNKIKSLQSSLAIEGNSLSEDEIATLLEGKLVFGSRNDILEVQNAFKVYDSIPRLDPLSEDDLLKSHGTLMYGLITDAGRYRNQGVGVVDGDRVIHIAPPHNRVPSLMGDLFDYLVHFDEEVILKSCVFHYGFEFIHPFSDGNGRMGRLWQTVILKSAYPVMAYVPFENIILQRQQGYYQSLQDAQSVGTSNPFIDFMLDALATSLREQLDRTANIQDYESRMAAFREHIGAATFARRDYQLFHKSISTATASRELTRAVDEGRLAKDGDKRKSVYRFV